MKFVGIEVTRSAKVNLGNYENTDIMVSVTAEVDETDNIFAAINSVTDVADQAVAQKVDDIEMGERKAKSKARRFGV